MGVFSAALRDYMPQADFSGIIGSNAIISGDLERPNAGGSIRARASLVL
jgi:hypothetical protein